MNPFPLEELKSTDNFNFECRGCAECCQNVKRSVMIESLDLVYKRCSFYEGRQPIRRNKHNRIVCACFRYENQAA